MTIKETLQVLDGNDCLVELNDNPIIVLLVNGKEKKYRIVCKDDIEGYLNDN